MLKLVGWNSSCSLQPLSQPKLWNIRSHRTDRRSNPNRTEETLKTLEESEPNDPKISKQYRLFQGLLRNKWHHKQYENPQVSFRARMRGKEPSIKRENPQALSKRKQFKQVPISPSILQYIKDHSLGRFRPQGVRGERGRGSISPKAIRGIVLKQPDSEADKVEAVHNCLFRCSRGRTLSGSLALLGEWSPSCLRRRPR